MHETCRVHALRASLGCVAILATVVSGPADATDWPMWRFDAHRSASSPEVLPKDLHLHWTLRAPPLKAAWPEDHRLQFDAVYQPIVVGSRMFIASNLDDTVTAFDIDQAQVLWRFHAGGPVRFAPVAHGGRIYFGADDGALYILEAASGKLLSKFVPSPSRKVLGNDRLISVHPVRGGPVIADGQIHFATGVWPFEGTFLYSLPLDHSSASVADVPPPYSVASLRDVVPQGYLAAADGRVFMPGGRSKVTSYRLADGGYDSLNYDAKGFTDYHASANEAFLFHGTKILDRKLNKTYPFTAPRPVVSGTRIYSTERGDVRAADLAKVRSVTSKDRRGRERTRSVVDELWRLDNEEIANGETVRKLRQSGTEEEPDAEYLKWLDQNPMVVAIRSGPRIYGYQASTIFALDLPADDKSSPSVSWKSVISGTPASLLSANGRLFVVTREGEIHGYGEPRGTPREIVLTPAGQPPKNPNASPASDEDGAAFAAHALATTDARDGYCVLVGAPADGVLQSLLQESRFRVIVLEGNETRATALRTKLDSEWTDDSTSPDAESGPLYGQRVSIQTGTNILRQLPPYLADLVIVRDPALALASARAESIDELFRLLRPYGGTAVWARDDSSKDGAEERLLEWISERHHADAEAQSDGDSITLRREGPLPGAADWAREYGDEGNTLTSRDTLVKAPLGVLWFGGPAGDSKLFYNRHNWPPSLTVVAGRMFIQGPGTLVSIDVYTGRVLWRKKIIDGGGGVSRRRELSLASGDRMGNPIFGTPAAGYHFLVEEDALYLAYPDRCMVLDPRSGEQINELRLETPDLEWGRIRSHQGLLIVPALEPADPERKKQRLPRHLIAMDRHTGEVKWMRKAEHAFPYVAIGKDRVFCFEADLEKLYRDKRRGNGVPNAKSGRVMRALDVETGDEKWSREVDMTANWLAFSDENNILVASNSNEIMAMHGSNGYELWRKKAKGVGFAGHPENLVHKVILWKDRVIDQRGPGRAYALESGADLTTPHPLTGSDVPWAFTKNGHHCNYAIASEHLLTFRAATAGFLDLESGGTSHLKGFRSGCRNSLIPAGGVLNAPNFANGCVCSYHVFTSLALVHVPSNEQWAYSAHKKPNGRVQRVGVNLGAPGDRHSNVGTLWLDYPNVGGPSPSIAVTTQPDSTRWFRQHASIIQDGELRWVAASGAKGLDSISIVLDEETNAKTAPSKYTARLYFNDPDKTSTGDRVFDVHLQGNPVLEGLDVVKEAGGPNRCLVKEFRGIDVHAELKVDLTAREGVPILSGIELIAETK